MGKVTVMLVDDERLAVEDLLNITDWEAQGFEIAATAVNGRKALDKFRKLRPQVIFTDIKMPYMDGIELIEHIRREDQTVKILLLTAYKDFSYAQSAIQYGSMDYIIKSDINEASINRTLAKLREMIESEYSARLVMDQRSIADFFAAEPGPDEERFLAQPLFTTPSRYLIVEQDRPLNISGDSLAEEKNHLKIGRASAALELDGADATLFLEGRLQRDQVLLGFQMKDPSQSRAHSLLHRLAGQAQQALQRQTGAGFTVYLVENEMDMAHFKQAYVKNMKSFHAKYLLGTSKLYQFPVRLSPREEDTYIDEDRVCALVDELDEPCLRAYVEGLIREAAATQNYMVLYYVARNLYDALRRCVRELPPLAAKPDISAAQNQDRWMNADEIAAWFGDKFAELLVQKRDARSSRYSRPIVEAMGIVRSRYGQSDLTVQTIAGQVHLSVGHLCALFKKETGKTVKDFITKERIAAAKRLLEGSQRKVYTISEAVGYRSSQYFSQVFYRQTGVYPADYQRGRGRSV